MSTYLEMLHFRKTYWIIDYIRGSAELWQYLLPIFFRVFLEFLKPIGICRSLSTFKGLFNYFSQVRYVFSSLLPCVVIPAVVMLQALGFLYTIFCIAFVSQD